MFAAPDGGLLIRDMVCLYNEGIPCQTSEKEKKIFIYRFLSDLDLFFPASDADADGVTGSILCDLLLLREGLDPVYFHLLREKYHDELCIAANAAQIT